MKNKYFITALLLLLFFCNSIYSQNAVSAAKKVENYLNDLEEAGFSGSVLVEIDGKKMLSKGYGYRDVEKKLKNSPETVFDIGSIAKQFTAAAILKLEMQGRLGTGDKITKYFANVPEDKAEITIHDLLRHQAGFPSVVGDDFEAIGDGEFVNKVFNAPLKFKNGTRFSYSNVGYSLLGMIVEKASGESYEQYLYKNLWKPAAMETTGYTRPKFDKNLIANGYSDEQVWGKPNEKSWDKDAPFWHLKGNGGILSTTEDLYKWHAALLSDKILSNEAKRKYFAPELRSGETEEGFYAYGWDVRQTARKTTVIQHNGTNRVFYADFRRFVDEKVSIIVLLNKADPNLVELAVTLEDIIFNPTANPPIPILETGANRRFTEEIIRIALEKDTAEAVKTYRNKTGKTDLLESFVNGKGYESMKAKDFDKAIKLFTLNVSVFKDSANAFDSLGEAYFENKNYDAALTNYKKSLELNARNGNAREMIEKIENILKNVRN